MEGVTGKYFDKKKPVSPSERARDAEFARALWEKTEALVKKSAAAAEGSAAG